MKVLYYLLLSIISLKCLAKPISTVPKIDLELFTGKWFQSATSKSTALFGTGPGFKNVSAIYQCIGPCKDNKISVFNEGINNSNKYTSIKGYSYCKNNSIPGKRKVVFDNLKFEGNYWIVKLGPVVNLKYDYAIVSGPLTRFFGTRFSLYVLCRNRKDFSEKYEEEVKNWCLENGYKYWWNKYRKTD